MDLCISSRHLFELKRSSLLKFEVGSLIPFFVFILLQTLYNLEDLVIDLKFTYYQIYF